MNKYKARLLALYYVAVFIKNHGAKACADWVRQDLADNGVWIKRIKVELAQWNKWRLSHNAAAVKRLKEASVKKS